MKKKIEKLLEKIKIYSYKSCLSIANLINKCKVNQKYQQLRG